MTLDSDDSDSNDRDVSSRTIPWEVDVCDHKDQPDSPSKGTTGDKLPPLGTGSTAIGSIIP